MKERESEPAAEELDDPSRLERERREQVADDAAKIRAVPLPREIEPPLTYRP